jgi:sulfur carrier protein ThiS
MELKSEKKMKLKVKVVGREREVDYFPGMSVKDLISSLGLTPDICIVVKNGQVVTEDEKIDISDDIKVITAISGG